MTDLMHNQQENTQKNHNNTQDCSSDSKEAPSSTFNQKYTLTGLIKSIESNLGELIISKKQSQI